MVLELSYVQSIELITQTTIVKQNHFILLKINLNLKDDLDLKKPVNSNQVKSFLFFNCLNFKPNKDNILVNSLISNCLNFKPNKDNTLSF